MAYVKEVFDVKTLEQAKHVVLTTDVNKPNKFKEETDLIIDSLKNSNIITKNSWVMDFGCGMGRVSKAIIDEFDCTVIGVDLSVSMLDLAHSYVGSANFKAATKWMFPDTIDACIAIFSIQHTEHPKKEINAIHECLHDNGYLILINEEKRFVPSAVDKDGYIIWNDDGINVFEEIEKKFKKIKSEPYLNTNIEIIYYQKVI